jgi:hypothetical protein
MWFEWAEAPDFLLWLLQLLLRLLVLVLLG